MTRTRVAIAGTIIAAIVGVLIAKGTAVWPFGSDKKQLAAILQTDSDQWLDGADIRAWTPDENFKPQSYFIVTKMSKEQFTRLATAARLTLNESRTIPSGVFVLPKGVTLSGWIEPEKHEAPVVDAHGTMDRAAVWSRWCDGVAYTVIHPVYD